MNYLLDSNILIYAKMAGMPEFPAVSKWLAAAVSDNANRITLCETSLLSFLRIATNNKVFDPPLPLKDARLFISKLLAHPNVEIFEPNPEHFSRLLATIEKHRFFGKLTMDAHLATIAMDRGCVLVTRDTDFKKIRYLKTLDPFYD